MSERTSGWNTSPNLKKRWKRDSESWAVSKLPNLEFSGFCRLVTVEIRPAKKDPTRETVGSDSQCSFFVPKDLVERECSSLFSRRGWGKRAPGIYPHRKFLDFLPWKYELRGKEQTLGDFHPEPSEREMPRSTSRKEETGKWICTDTRCVSTSCTYSLGSRTYHQSWLLPAHGPLVKPQQSPQFIETSYCCTHPCSKHENPCSILSLPDSLILVALLKIFDP